MIRRRVLVVLLLMACLIGVGWHYYTKKIAAEIWIDAAPEVVFEYLSQDSFAKDWSVYFDHIFSLSGMSGEEGSVRRCFRRADEQGIYWDERTVVSNPPYLRRIETYNLTGFNVDLSGLIFLVEQDYQGIDGGTRLRFSTKLKKPSVITSILLGKEANEASEIFKLNLENIKAILEGGRHRLHPYKDTHYLD